MGIYENQVWAYPSEKIAPDKKDAKWIAQYGRAMLSDYLHNGGQRWFNAREDYKELEDYARGRQSIDRYKSRKGTPTAKGHKFKEKNIDLSVLPLIPDFIQKMKGRLAGAQYEATVTAVDATAMDERADYEYKMKAQMEFRDLMQKIGTAPEGMEIPMDDDELQLKMMLGYKHMPSMKVEMALASAIYQSNYEQLQSEMDFYAITFGDFCAKDSLRNGKPWIESIHPRDMVVLPSRYEDYRDKKAFGHFERMTVGDLRSIAGDEFTEKEYEAIASHFKGSGGWPRMSELGYGAGYDSQQIEVFRFEVLSYDEKVYKAGKDEKGNPVLRKRGYNSTNKDHIRKGYLCLYEGIIIPNTNWYCKCQRAFDQKREPGNYADCTSSYHPFSLGQSMVGMIIPAADQAQRAWLRLNSAIAEAVPKGYKYDLDALENIALGKAGEGQNLTTGEIIEFHELTGRFLYRSRGIDGAKEYGNSEGIKEMENGLPGDVGEYFNIIRNAVYLIQSITGQNPTALGQTNPDIGKGVSEIAMTSADHSLHYIYRARESVFQKLTKALALRVFDQLENGGIESSYVQKSGSKSRTKVVSISKEEAKRISKYRFETKVEVKPTEQEWNLFYQTAQRALDNQQITLADWAYLMEVDNLKQARMLLAVREKKNKAEAMAQAQQQQEANAQVQMQSAQAAEAAKQQTIQVKLEADMTLEDKKSQNRRIEQAERYGGEKELEQMRISGKVEGKMIDAEKALAQEAKKGENKLMEKIADLGMEPETAQPINY